MSAVMTVKELADEVVKRLDDEVPMIGDRVNIVAIVGVVAEVLDDRGIVLREEI